MKRLLATLLMGFALFTPALADCGNCDKDKKDCDSCKQGSAQCADKDSCCGEMQGCCCCGQACGPRNFQACSTSEKTCPNGLALQEGRQPYRWHRGDTSKGITIQNDGCRPDHTLNYMDGCHKMTYPGALWDVNCSSCKK